MWAAAATAAAAAAVCYSQPRGTQRRRLAGVAMGARAALQVTALLQLQALPLLLLGAATASTAAAAAAAATAAECAPLNRGKAPGQLVARGVNASARAVILHAHNALRERVASGRERRGAPGPQPPARNMAALKWDEDLAKFAQRWADHRLFQHNPCRTMKKFPTIGENLAMKYSFSTVPNDSDVTGWKKSIDDWYNEVDEWPNSTVSKYIFSERTGHYTQLLWAETRRVGCGYTAFKEDKAVTFLFVCNYAPAGNVVGRALYAQGAPRSACRRRPRNRRYPSLCLF